MIETLPLLHDKLALLCWGGGKEGTEIDISFRHKAHIKKGVKKKNKVYRQTNLRAFISST
jgi:hypothetical protein